jgi:hypothetical protein
MGPSAPHTQVAKTIFKYVPKSRRKEGQSPFEEVIRPGGVTKKCTQTLTKETLQILREDPAMPLPALGQLGSIKSAAEGFVKSLHESFQHVVLPEKRTGGFDPKTYKLLANSGYNFADPASLGELSPELTGEKVHGLSEAQKKLRQQGHKVSPPKTGLGFTPPEPIRIAAKGKGKKTNVQHITVEEVKEDDVNKILL